MKEATVIYDFHPLAARLPELESKLERLNCTYLFNSEHKSKLPTDHDSSSGKRRYEIVEVHFAEMTEAVTTRQASVTTLNLSVGSAGVRSNQSCLFRFNICHTLHCIFYALIGQFLVLIRSDVH